MEGGVVLALRSGMLRQGLRLLLEEAGVTVLAETGEAGEVVSLMEASPAAVLVLDVSIGDPGSVELTSRVRRQSPGVQVLALVTPPRRQLMGRVLEIGAAGCVLVSSPFSELRRGVEAVAAGQTYLGRGVAGLVVDQYVRNRPGGKAHGSPLTPREREVVQLLAEGLVPREIAQRLEVSVRTVDTHRYQVMRKLSFRGLADLTRYALREGLISLVPETPSVEEQLS